jgi:hypothetical protein
MAQAVIITFGTFVEGWCPSTTNEFVSELNSIVSAVTEGGLEVRIQFGVMLPGFCPESIEEFIAGMNSITTGYVVSTGQSVHVEFSGDIFFNWGEPATVVDSLAGHYTAYVEGT